MHINFLVTTSSQFLIVKHDTIWGIVLREVCSPVYWSGETLLEAGHPGISYTALLFRWPPLHHLCPMHHFFVLKGSAWFSPLLCRITRGVSSCWVSHSLLTTFKGKKKSSLSFQVQCVFRKWCSCVVPVLYEGFTDVANLLFVHSPREVNGVYGLIFLLLI